MVSLVFIAKGTGDDGDSVLHFLYARYAFHHPENFFNQWAKPMYVLFASPFAQFGFTGIKIFNVVVSAAAIYFSYRSVKLLQIGNAWFVVVAMCCAPMNIHLTLSGLTEPLFALALSIVIFLALKEKHTAAALLVSFLPFFRSEGLIIICVYIFYLLFKKKWKLIPLLAAGHVAFSIAGYFYYKDFLWVFNKLSYATLHSVYGEGSPVIFVRGMVEYLGWMLLIFFSIGAVAGVARFAISFFMKEKKFPLEEFWLVFGSFFSVWIGHMIFWWFGIFNSFGLTRVLIEVLPCAAMISTRGFSAVNDTIKIFDSLRARLLVAGIFISAVLITSFVQLHWSCDFGLTGGEKAIDKAATKYNGELKGYTIYSTAPYVSAAFNFDNFDSTKHRLTDKILSDKKIQEKSAVVWDNYAATESRVALGNLMVDPRLVLLDTFQSKDCHGNENTVAVFRFTGSDTALWKVRDTIYVNDFERENFSPADSIALSGKYSVAVNDENQYSPGLDAPVKE